MSRARDDARRNARQAFATTRSDGSPVESRLIAYEDGCVNGVLRGDVFTSSFTSDHSSDGHVPCMAGPFSYERFDELTRVDDYGWDE